MESLGKAKSGIERTMRRYPRIRYRWANNPALPDNQLRSFARHFREPLSLELVPIRVFLDLFFAGNSSSAASCVPHRAAFPQGNKPSSLTLFPGRLNSARARS
jgi:hypothetical protein